MLIFEKMQKKAEGYTSPIYVEGYVVPNISPKFLTRITCF